MTALTRRRAPTAMAWTWSVAGAVGLTGILVAGALISTSSPSADPMPETDDSSPAGDGVLFPPTVLEHTSLFLDLNNTLDRTVTLEVHVPDVDRETTPWFFYYELFAADGTQKARDGIGHLPWDREMIVLTHEDETHRYGPPDSAVFNHTQSFPWDPREVWPFPVDPGPHHLLVSLSHTSATVSVRAAEGDEDAFEVGQARIDPNYFRWRLSYVDEDWSEVRSEVYLTNSGQFMKEASTVEEIHHAYARFNVWGLFRHQELVVEVADGRTCSDKGFRNVPYGFPQSAWGSIWLLDLPPGPVKVDASGTYNRGIPGVYASPGFYLMIVDLPLPPMDRPDLWCFLRESGDGQEAGSEGDGFAGPARGN